ncbi:hypothetical protein TRVA0_030S00452 [Trichomonascus vanleenenianus]|uniref:WD40 repeat domain-containing protein n=1 Tax=Trichomonascus vanleenenianus TaxID=2268995 RepID=UPI003ECB27CB
MTNGEVGYCGFSKSEVTRLLIQALYDLNYSSIAKQLQEESGCRIESDEVSHFQTAVLNGQWNLALAAIQTLDLAENKNVDEMKFLIYRENLLEELLNDNQTSALHILRSHISRLSCDSPEFKKEVKNLSSLIMFSADDIRSMLDWGTVEESRRDLLLALNKYISPESQLPPHRLASLLTDLRDIQMVYSDYAVGTEQFSLYRDFEANREDFPSMTRKVLTAHTNEVWFIAFSHNGKYLASASRDRQVIVWNTQDWTIHRSLDLHRKGVIMVSWSPDDTMLLSCGEDNTCILWNVDMGQPDVIMDKAHTEAISSCGFFNSGTHFFTASPDKNLIVWDLSGSEVHRFVDQRILCAAISPNDQFIVAADSDDNLTIFDLSSMQVAETVPMKKRIASISISSDSRYALINTSPGEIFLWDLIRMRPVKKFVGQVQREMVIQSSFGGYRENFILSGSQDNYVYIWNRATGNLIETLSGHTASVNCVKWHPTSPNTIASASDDGTIRIWGPSESS